MIGNNAVGGKKKYEPLVPGQYSVTLQRVAEKSTKAGNGAYLDASFEVAEGENKGRLIFEKFMIDHPNPKVVEIGRQRLDKFLKAAGAPNGLEGLNQDTSEDTIGKFANNIVLANVAIEEGTNGYSDRNKITSFGVR